MSYDLNDSRWLFRCFGLINLSEPVYKFDLAVNRTQQGFAEQRGARRANSALKLDLDGHHGSAKDKFCSFIL